MGRSCRAVDVHWPLAGAGLLVGGGDRLINKACLVDDDDDSIILLT